MVAVGLPRIPIEDKARQVFAERFPGSRAELGWTASGRSLIGPLGWDGFRGMESLDAVRPVDRVIEEAFTPDKQDRISAIIPVNMSALEAAIEPLG